MSLATILSHLGTIRGALDALEAVASAVIPGAAPVVAAIQSVEGPVMNAVGALTGAAPAVPVPLTAGLPAGATWCVADLSPAQNILFGGARADCEAWADKSMTDGYSVRPVNL